MKRGFFVSLEGIEGSGKSTLLSPLKRYFENLGKKVLITREPGGTDLGNELRAIILHHDASAISAVTELFLIQAARSQHVHQVLQSALNEYDLILCDRFRLSTLAYQWGGRGIDRAMVERMNELSTGGLQEDLVVLLDLPTSLALERRQKRKGARDRFERETLPFHDKVRAAYLDLAKESPERIKIFDAAEHESALEKAVAEEIRRHLVSRA